MAALTLFYSYANADEALRDQLEKHLTPLQREGLISTWHNRKIPPGGVQADPMPVIFPLASWAEKRFSLADWLIEELFLKYQVPRHVGHSWIKDNQLLLLLDGLDEVTQVHRSACLEAINVYRQDHNILRKNVR